MVQFKDVFLGLERRAVHPRDDLAEVRARRRQAQRPGERRPHRAPPHLLRDARQLLVRRLLQGRRDRLRLGVPDRRRWACPSDRLWVTVFRDDDEAAALWQKIAGLPRERVIRLGEKDNFWQMGDTGPCGPCSEIHYRPGPGGRLRAAGAARSGCDCDRYLEIWNLVFMQFNRDAAGTLAPLPRPASTPAWASSASPRSCRACRATTTPTCSRRCSASSRRPAAWRYGADAEARRLDARDRRPLPGARPS